MILHTITWVYETQGITWGCARDSVMLESRALETLPINIDTDISLDSGPLQAQIHHYNNLPSDHFGYAYLNQARPQIM